MDLKKIFINILANAFRHTNEGYVKVSALENQVIFENSGDKIKNEYIDKIFEPFFTVCKSKNRTQSGFGLGLSIVKNLSNNNGFSCYVKESNLGKTVFVLEKLKKD
jgi:signal transduction histidine kinase